jgi:hypothetical protein
MGKCEYCLHFRPQRNLEQLLKLETDRPSPVLRDIRERDKEWEETESETLIDLLLSGQRAWPGESPPRVLPYCGLEEEQRRFLVHESKNAGERCRDFVRAFDTPLGFCSDCTHREKAWRPARDREELQHAARVGFDIADVNASYRGQSDPSGWHAMRRSLSEGIDERKSDDMLAALESGGETQRLPGYYDYCRKFSQGGPYVLCRVRNYYGRCPRYSAREQTAAPPAVRPAAPDGTKRPAALLGTKTPSKPRRWRDGGGF